VQSFQKYVKYCFMTRNISRLIVRFVIDNPNYIQELLEWHNATQGLIGCGVKNGRAIGLAVAREGGAQRLKGRRRRGPQRAPYAERLTVAAHHPLNSHRARAPNISPHLSARLAMTMGRKGVAGRRRLL
jgi:hypothetical protein